MEIDRPTVLSDQSRFFFGALLAAGFTAMLVGAVTIPFLFESSSILYKFGHGRQVLLAGQVLGLAAGCLLLLQIILGARLKSLDRLFGLNNLFRLHRLTGFGLAGLALIHPALIFISDGRFSIPLQGRYWPEFIGLFLLVVISAMVITSHWREGLRLAFHRWWPLHRIASIVAFSLFFIHLLNANDTFRQAIPRLIAIGGLGLGMVAIGWMRTRNLRNRSKAFRVAAIGRAAKDAISLKITPVSKATPPYLPGQFAFLTLDSPNLPMEEHPFTIASSPSEPDGLEFVIRTTGDWTGQLGNLQSEARILLDGPFGLFSHRRLPMDKELVLIAGGIGITPMLSMLRHMADHNDPRKVTLIWSNRTKEHIIFPAEFEALAARLPNISMTHILTRDPQAKAVKRRLDEARLETLTAACSKSAAVFICGPDAMMRSTAGALIALGFNKRAIFMERFGL